MIEVVCVCKRRFEVQDEHAGLSIKCPECRRLVSVPDAVAEPGPIPDTIPPPGLHIPPGALDPPPPEDAPAAAHHSPGDRLVAALETMTALGRTIRVLLACILGVLILMLLELLRR